MFQATGSRCTRYGDTQIYSGAFSAMILALKQVMVNCQKIDLHSDED